MNLISLPIKLAIKNKDKILQNILDTFSDSKSPRILSYKSQVQTHISLLTQIVDSVNHKFGNQLQEIQIHQMPITLINNIDKITRNEDEIEALFKKPISVTTSVIKTITQFKNFKLMNRH